MLINPFIDGEKTLVAKILYLNFSTLLDLQRFTRITFGPQEGSGRHLGENVVKHLKFSFHPVCRWIQLTQILFCWILKSKVTG